MKQHITVKQLQKLSNKQQIKLATLFGEYGNCCNVGGETMNLGKLSDRINIGKMIEIIHKQYSEEMIMIMMHKGWSVTLCDYHGTDISNGEHEQLCNALWEVVKDIIR